MIRMTLHSVTVECETLPQALELLDRWARAGQITLPPEPAKGRDTESVLMVALGDETSGHAVSSPLPRVPAPSKPKPRKAPGSTETRKCRVCEEPFPATGRLVTCPKHRLKPGENVETARKKFLEVKLKAAAPATRTARSAPDRATAKGLLSRPPLRPDEPSKPCSACGDKTREAELDAKGRCKDCQPIGGKA